MEEPLFESGQEYLLHIIDCNKNNQDNIFIDETKYKGVTLTVNGYTLPENTKEWKQDKSNPNIYRTQIGDVEFTATYKDKNLLTLKMKKEAKVKIIKPVGIKLSKYVYYHGEQEILDDENDEKWLSKKEVDKIGGWLTFEGEGKEGTITMNSDGSITSNAGTEFTRIPHCPTNTSGVTIGRGVDLKLRNPEDVSKIFNSLHIEYKCELLNDELHNWLIKGCKKVGKNAMQYIKEINNSVKPKNKHISRKKQFFLFKIAYKEKHDYAIGVVERQFKLDMKELPLQIKDVLVDIIYVGLPKDIKNAIEPSLKVKNYKKFREALVDLGKIKKDSRWDKRVKYLDENYFVKGEI